MTRTDDCQDCKGGGLVPGSGCTCDGDAQHLYTYDLHCVHGQRRARCVPDRKVISGQSRSVHTRGSDGGHARVPHQTLACDPRAISQGKARSHTGCYGYSGTHNHDRARLAFAQLSGPLEPSWTSGQGRGRTADLPLFQGFRRPLDHDLITIVTTQLTGIGAGQWAYTAIIATVPPCAA